MPRKKFNKTTGNVVLKCVSGENGIYGFYDIK